MLAGGIVVIDIVITWGTAITLGACLVIAAVFVCAAIIDDYICNKRAARQLQIAQNIELGDGVTLLEGIEAYFDDDDVFWGTSYKERAMVMAVDERADAFMRIYLPAQEIVVESFRQKDSPDDNENPQILIDLMIQAAKRQREHPET